MKAIERIYQYIDFEKIKIASFEKSCGISNGYLAKMLKRNADIGESILIQILENCPNISPEWLLTGHGAMLRRSDDQHGEYKEVPSDDAICVSDYKDVYIKQLEGENGRLISDNKKKQELIDGFLSGSIHVNKKTPPDISVSHQGTG